MRGINLSLVDPTSDVFAYKTHTHTHTVKLAHSYDSTCCMSGVKIKEQLHATPQMIDWKWSQCDGDLLCRKREKRERIRGEKGREEEQEKEMNSIF